jgi:hypothetical protein
MPSAHHSQQRRQHPTTARADHDSKKHSAAGDGAQYQQQSSYRQKSSSTSNHHTNTTTTNNNGGTAGSSPWWPSWLDFLACTKRRATGTTAAARRTRRNTSSDHSTTSPTCSSSLYTPEQRELPTRRSRRRKTQQHHLHRRQISDSSSSSSLGVVVPDLSYQRDRHTSSTTSTREESKNEQARAATTTTTIHLFYPQGPTNRPSLLSAAETQSSSHHNVSAEVAAKWLAGNETVPAFTTTTSAQKSIVGSSNDNNSHEKSHNKKRERRPTQIPSVRQSYIQPQQSQHRAPHAVRVRIPSFGCGGDNSGGGAKGFRQYDRSTGRSMANHGDDDNDRHDFHVAEGSVGSLSSNDDQEEIDADNDDENDDGDDDDDDDSSMNEAIHWKTAVDATSGRTYYYHTQTRETQWEKPLCCAAPAERSAAKAREASTRNFFAAMEANIRRSINDGNGPNSTIIGGSSLSQLGYNAEQQQQQERTNRDDAAFRKSAPASSRPTLPHPALVRTISSMEASVLADLVQRVPSNRSFFTNTTRSTTGGGNSTDNDNYSISTRPLSPSNSETTEDSLSPVKQMRGPGGNFRMISSTSFLSRSSNGGLRGSMTRLPVGHRGSMTMKLVPEEIHEDLSGSSYDNNILEQHQPHPSQAQQHHHHGSSSASNLNDPPAHRFLDRSPGALRLNAAAAVAAYDDDDEEEEESSRPADSDHGDTLSSVVRLPFGGGGISRENSLSLESLVGPPTSSSSRNVIRHQLSRWANNHNNNKDNDSYRHPSFSQQDANGGGDDVAPGSVDHGNSSFATRHVSQSSLRHNNYDNNNFDATSFRFNNDSTMSRWGGGGGGDETSFYSRASSGFGGGGTSFEDETMMALAAISREMAAASDDDDDDETPRRRQLQPNPPTTRRSVPTTPTSTIDGLEGLNLASSDDDEDDEDEDEPYHLATFLPLGTTSDDEDDRGQARTPSSEPPRPQMLRPLSLRVPASTNTTTAAALSSAPVLRPSMKRRNTCGTVRDNVHAKCLPDSMAAAAANGGKARI